MASIFDLQDRINQKIVAALAVRLTGVEREQLARMETSNVDAYDAFLQGWGYYRRRTPDDWAKAVSYFQKAIEIDPNYGRAFSALGSLYFWCTRYGWGGRLGTERDIYKLAEDYTKRAMNNPTPHAHWLASQMRLRFHKHEEAVAEADQAIARDPNDPDNHAQMAYALIFAGRPEEAVDSVRKAMRLDPHYPAYYLYVHGLAYFAIGELEEAVVLLERAHRRNPEVRRWAAPLAASYALLGHDKEARALFEKYDYVLTPRAKVLSDLWYYWPFKDPNALDRLIEGLREAGMT